MAKEPKKNLTPEERAARKEKRAQRLATMTPEQREERKAKLQARRQSKTGAGGAGSAA
ncbi:MAG TPA: hypothetical protein VF559_13120 [Caulobacteraceae bacterium]|jgi:hypothetical protein